MQKMILVYLANKLLQKNIPVINTGSIEPLGINVKNSKYIYKLLLTNHNLANARVSFIKTPSAENKLEIHNIVHSLLRGKVKFEIIQITHNPKLNGEVSVIIQV